VAGWGEFRRERPGWVCRRLTGKCDVTFPAPPAAHNGFFNAGQTPVVGHVTATDSSHVTAIQCVDSIGGLTLGALSGGGTASATRSLTVAGDGTHAISCVATDGATPPNTGSAPGSANGASVAIDATAPQITAPHATTPIASTTATLVWTTDEASSTRVDYGLTQATETTSVADPVFVTSHSLVLGPLSAGTTYHFRVQSTDLAGNTGSSTGDLTFTTASGRGGGGGGGGGGGSGGQAGSARFNGTTAFAEAAHAADLNLTGDWTVEAWFRDDDPAGFNHDYREIVMKGDRNANAEAPYFVLVGQNKLIAGVHTAGVDYPISWDLAYLKLDPKAWHHVAVSFSASLNVINLWLDGQHIAYLQVPAHSTTGNTLPLEIGRGGPATGKYWIGKIDDLRIWNVARTGANITAHYKTEFTTAQAHLVANWRFNDPPAPKPPTPPATTTPP
jgi:hypothetical protein